jgi:carboxypeptidase C (cathepsin A)
MLVKKLIGLFIISTISKSDFSDTDGPWSLLGVSGYSGEVVVNPDTGSSLFYWLFQSIGGDINTDRRPLIFWFQGGPGCSGELGMLGERISPIYIDDAGQPHYNNQSWAQDFHLLSVDFPYGVGNSYPTALSDYETSSQSAATTFYTFLQRMMVKYPKWFSRDIYIFGESYGGHWVPAIAYKIIMMNQALPINGYQYVNLKGIGLGDPWIDGRYQGVKYDQFVYDLGLSNLLERTEVVSYENTISETVSTDTLSAYDAWGDLLSYVGYVSDNVNYYNIRTYSDQDTGNLALWLNDPVNQNLLHIPNNVVWTECNYGVNANFSADFFANQSYVLPTIIENVKVLIYNGQDDLIVNTIGVELLLSNLDWPFIKNFLGARKIVWKVLDNIAGYATSYKNLNFVMILKAGHLAPFDQPVNVKNMVQRYIFNQGWG